MTSVVPKVRELFRIAVKYLGLPLAAVAVIAAPSLLMGSKPPEFFYVSTAILFALLSMPRVSAFTLGFGRELQRRWTIALAIVALIPIGAIFTSHQLLLRSSNDAYRSRGVAFLGAWSGPVDEAFLVSLLEKDIPAEQITALGALYRGRYPAGKGLSVSRALKDKRESGAVEAAVKLFDWKKLSFDDRRAAVRALYDAKLKHGGDFREKLYSFPPRKFTAAELATLVSSSHEGEVLFGLTASRFDQHAEMSGALLRGFAKIPDRWKEFAAGTLSLLTGTRWSIGQALGLEKRPVSRGIASEVGCGRFKDRKLSSLAASEYDVAGACLRSRMRARGDSAVNLQSVDTKLFDWLLSNAKWAKLVAGHLQMKP